MFNLKGRIISLVERLIRANFIVFLILKKIFLPRTNKPLDIKISVFNTYDSGGGAAKIALQLSQFLMNEYSLCFYVKTKKTTEKWISEIPIKKYTFLEEVLRREAFLKGWIEFTGFHVLKLTKDSFFTSSKIIHLHNLHGEFFSPSLYNSLFNGKKVIWTLHDESFITGHCSCTLGCERWKIGCGECPDLTIYPSVRYDNTKAILYYKKKWIQSIQPIVVCPSKWLADRVRIAYPELKQIEVIPNGIDTKIFYPMDKEKSRLALGLPLDKKIVLFVAEFATNNPFKGGGILRDIIADSSFSDIIFVTVGGTDRIDFENHISFPYVSDEAEIAVLYSACDVLLYPTQADNFPLVVLESMACGTPVIASNLGGINEIIEDRLDGLLVTHYSNSIKFKKSLHDFLNFSSIEYALFSRNSVKKINTNFSSLIMQNSYNHLYKYVLNVSKASV
jgi:glycosyltransferase involved in cell wall biosynthesis